MNKVTTILFISHDRTTCHTITSYLNPQDYQVHCVHTDLALYLATNPHPPAIILLDDGDNRPSQCQTLKSQAHWPDVPLVFMTQHRDKATLTPMLAAGMDELLFKPLHPDELRLRLQSLSRWRHPPKTAELQAANHKLQTEVAQRNREIERKTQELTILNKASHAIVSSLELNTVLDHIILEIKHLFEAEAASVLLHMPDTQELVFSAVASPASEMLLGTAISATKGIAGWVTQQQRPLLTTNARHDTRFCDDIDILTGMTTRSLLASPLVFNGATVGVIEVINRARSAFNQHDLDILQALSNSAATAIQNARLFEQLQKQNLELNRLYRASETLLSSVEPNIEHLAQAIVETVLREFEQSNCSLILLQRNSNRLIRVAVAGPYAQKVSQNQLTLDGPGLVAVAIRSGQILNVSNTQAHPDYLSNWQATRSELTIPLKIGTEVIGAIDIQSSKLGSFSLDDERLIATFAEKAALAIENARLFKETKQHARQNAHLYKSLKEQIQTLQETQAQLIHSAKIAALGRLAASMAHEINNPLQSVQGCLSLTQEELNGRKRQHKLDRYLDVVQSEVDRISGIVRRLRDFYLPARQEREPTDLHAILNSILELSNKQLEHSHVTVERHWPAPLPHIRANSDHLKQVFLNLLLNAIDAMPNGGTLTIATSQKQMIPYEDNQPLPAICIQFHDTGQGIPADLLPRLFEPFFTTKESGSGLGLSISYNIIEAHDGQMSVASQEGVGTTFTILLPHKNGSL